MTPTTNRDSPGFTGMKEPLTYSQRSKPLGRRSIATPWERLIWRVGLAGLIYPLVVTVIAGLFFFVVILTFVKGGPPLHEIA